METLTAISDLTAAVCRHLDGIAHPRCADAAAALRHHAIGAPRSVVARSVPALEHLRPALDAMSDRPLASAIAAAAPALAWVTYDAYDRVAIGEAFAAGHCFASLAGEGAPYPATDFDAGLFLIAPHVLYRDHHHAAPELYLPLTGPHGWRFRPGDALQWLPAGEPVWNDPWQPHATMTGDLPLLCIFVWMRDVAAPARVVPATDWSVLEDSGRSD